MLPVVPSICQYKRFISVNNVGYLRVRCSSYTKLGLMGPLPNTVKHACLPCEYLWNVPP